jgi:inorganic pyrophosphatase
MLRVSGWLGGVALGFVLLPAFADTASAVQNVKHFPQPQTAPAELYAVVEIPTGSIAKYELDDQTGHLILDRFQSMPVAYPGNYGIIPSSLAEDGDPLDVLVYSREPIVPGALLRVRPIGVLIMQHGGEQDDKIIAVPADDVDPTYAEVRDISDLPSIERERLRAFFLTYDQLPAGRKKVELGPLEDRDAALRIVRAALAAFLQ